MNGEQIHPPKARPQRSKAEQFLADSENAVRFVRASTDSHKAAEAVAHLLRAVKASNGALREMQALASEQAAELKKLREQINPLPGE